MASYNRVTIVGNLTRDPEVKHLAGGTAVAGIGIALNRSWTDKVTGVKHEDVTCVDVTLWARTAEVVGEYLSKGSQVLIEGRLQTDSWTDKDTQQKRTKLKIVGERMVMLGTRAARGEQTQDPFQQPAGDTVSAPIAAPAADGEVPF